jgi:hypothetical protein
MALGLAALILLIAGLTANRGEIEVREDYFGDEHYINSTMTFYRNNKLLENIDLGAERDLVKTGRKNLLTSL